MGKLKPHEFQNNFVARPRREEKDGEPESSRREIELKRKQRAIILLKQTKKKGKVDRFGKPLSDGYEGVFVEQQGSSSAGSVGGNKFAPTFKDPKKVNLRSDKGVKFVFTVLLSVGLIYLMLMYPHYVPLYYVSSIIPLFMYRFVSYYLVSRHHFCLEVCYFINYTLLAYILVVPDMPEVFMGAFALSMSVGIGSTLILNFKMVFSDIQQFINMYMHVSPAVTCFAIRWLAVESTPLIGSFTVCPSYSKDACPFLVDFYTALTYFFVFPIAGYASHMLLFNFWVWVVPHPNLHKRKNYCNTFIKLMQGGFGDRWVDIMSVFGRKWALWVYSFAQIAWAAVFLIAVSPLYYSKLATFIYLCVLLVQILGNGGSFYAYKLRKLEEVEKKVKEYEDDSDSDTALENDFFAEEEGRASEGRGGGEWTMRGKGSKRRQISTVIRTVDKFKVSTTGYGRAHRAEMSRRASNGKRVKVANLEESEEREKERNEGRGGRGRKGKKQGGKEVGNEREVYVGKLAAERRLECQKSARPSVPY
ncbi:hypothetical protein TrCOL_g6504 [Triparma columacea]|uniref:Glycerophosphocholine acyltransferase 1 n=2 Tax=Triparma columacea TaxID=722753 RepID=A0A9W7LAC5_9STRA|nr:hypothetical protein TrCOL_g6504 [Triparma columacea]